MITINIAYIIAMMGIPTAITAFFIRWFEKKQEERDKSQKKKDVLMIKAINASLALGEATAHAIKKRQELTVRLPTRWSTQKTLSTI